MKTLFKICLAVFLAGNAYGQSTPTKQEVDDLKKSVNDLNEKVDEKPFQVGLSLAYRKLKANDEKYFYSPSINPIDSTLQIDIFRPKSIVISSELLITPFTQNTDLKEALVALKNLKKDNGFFECAALDIARISVKFIQRITFIGTVNLVTFQKAQTEFAFNKQIEGGGGIGIKFTRNFWIGGTYEINNVRVLRDKIRAMENQKIQLGGKATVYQLDPTDESLFVTRSLTSFNFKFIFSF